MVSMDVYIQQVCNLPAALLCQTQVNSGVKRRIDHRRFHFRTDDVGEVAIARTWYLDDFGIAAPSMNFGRISHLPNPDHKNAEPLRNILPLGLRASA